MKNILKILEEFGLEIPEDKKKDFEKAVLENYKTTADYETQKGKLDAAEDKVRTTEDALKKFEGIDPDKLKGEIDTLNGDLKKKDEEYQQQIADRDFNDLLKDSISSAKGVNARAIAALLDVDTLKASKNQKDDVSAAIKALTEAENSKMLFGEPEPQAIGTGNIIGEVRKSNSNTEDAALRSAMGLPPVAEQN